MKSVSNVLKAKIIAEALPYMQAFRHKVLVIKLGGSVIDNKDQPYLDFLIQDLTLLKTVGTHPIIIHGGGKQISQLTQKLGKKSRFINGIRVTDGETMDITQMILAGLINKNLVSLIEQKGGQAVGISGKDGNIALAKPLQTKGESYGHAGEILAIDTKLIQTLIDHDYIPVIAPIANDHQGKSLNINADTFAAEIALTFQAEKLIFISDVLGVMGDIKNKDSLYSKLSSQEIPELIRKKIVYEGMIPKLQAAHKAIEKGVSTVHFISEKIHHALLIELFTPEGVGTLIYKKPRKSKKK